MSRYYQIALFEQAPSFFFSGPSQSEAFWKVDHDRAERIDITNSALAAITADPGEHVVTTLQRRFQGTTFHELSLGPGEYYRRMARPSSTRQGSPVDNPDKSDVVRQALAEGMGQLRALIEQLEHICRIVHPIEENLKAFGHEIRNVLIACTEAEAQWKNILKANGVKEEDRTKTNHYVKLLKPMKLNEYEVELTHYPWLDPVKPFKDWCARCPSQSLEWWEAYNLVKRNREERFREATLKRAIDAVSGCFVMLCAQYGWEVDSRGNSVLDVASLNYQQRQNGLRPRYTFLMVHPSQYHTPFEKLNCEPSVLSRLSMTFE
jgi:hypothetical protein